MKDLFNIANYYIEGKPIYAPIVRLLNLLFLLCISSFIYEKIYGVYEWLDFSDYKSILNYLIKGKFFIPFSIFISVYSITQFISFMIIKVLLHLFSVKIQQKIIDFQLKEKDIENNLNKLETTSKRVSPIVINKEILTKYYFQIKNKLTSEKLEDFKKGIESSKKNTEDFFVLLVRCIIVISIFKFSLPEYGLFLYIVTLICIVLGLVISFFGYWLLGILPTIIRKFSSEFEAYLDEGKTPN